MGLHRNIFFSQIRPGVLTSTQIMLESLKEELSKKSSEEAKIILNQ